MTVARFFTLSKAILCRSIFILHALIVILRVNQVKKQPIFWYLLAGLYPMVIEAAHSIIQRRGKEYRWFCPSIFLYLLSVVPSIWILELEKIRYNIRKHLYHQSMQFKFASGFENYSVENSTIFIGKYKIPFQIKLKSENWVLVLEQMLVFILIVGRWLLPKGKLSRNELSQLLLVYIGTAADIMELFEVFKEENVKFNLTLSIVILGIWSWSFFQFTIVFTQIKSRKKRLGTLYEIEQIEDSNSKIFLDVIAILTTLILQDLPFIVLRLTLIFYYEAVSVMTIFFTLKNLLVISLQIYRLLILYMSYNKNKKIIVSKATKVKNFMSSFSPSRKLKRTRR